MKAASRVVPLVIEAVKDYSPHTWRDGPSLPIAGVWQSVGEYRESVLHEVEAKVQASLGWGQLLLWRLIIPVIIKLVVRWWFSDRGAAMRGLNK